MPKPFNVPKGAAGIERVRYFRRLLRTHRKESAPIDYNRLVGGSDRISDAEALFGLLDLPEDAKEAVVHHIHFLTLHAPTDVLRVRLKNGRWARPEAFTIATISLVMERYRIERPGTLDRMFEAFTFKGASPHITSEEYERVFQTLAAWFGSKLWRDGPEDARPQ